MKVGITTTVPVEILFAAGLSPLDLNNLFITSPSPASHLDLAERAGFPHSTCAWIKGIYSVTMKERIQTVVAVVGGDCSNTVALAEVLEKRGIEVIPFQYPYDRDPARLQGEMETLITRFSTSWKEIEKARIRLDRIRAKLSELDRLTYEENKVTGYENHLFLVSSSDFGGDSDKFESRLDSFLAMAKGRSPMREQVRLGYLGVPPIFSDIYDRMEQLGARVVFNEVQRQFSMPFETTDLVERYLLYTYPYGTDARVADITKEASVRGLDGLIHYTQTFCHRQISDIIFREEIDLPMLTLEGDRPGEVDARTFFRIETFVEMLQSGRGSALC